MSDNNSGGGLGLVGVVTVVLIVLKVIGVQPVAEWHWLLVLCGPFLCAVALWVVFVALVGGVVGTGVAGAGIASWWGRRRMLKMMEKVGEEEAREAEEARGEK